MERHWLTDEVVLVGATKFVRVVSNGLAHRERIAVHDGMPKFIPVQVLAAEDGTDERPCGDYGGAEVSQSAADCSTNQSVGASSPASTANPCVVPIVEVARYRTANHQAAQGCDCSGGCNRVGESLFRGMAEQEGASSATLPHRRVACGSLDPPVHATCVHLL